MKSALVVVQRKGCSCTSMCPRHGCIHARRVNISVEHIETYKHIGTPNV
ncbi:MAG: hypothetical protein P8179_15420 [Candidatus Thiodiazotropha sp.]